MKITYHITREDFIDAQKLHRSRSPSARVRAIRLGAKVLAVAVFVVVLGLAAVTWDRKVWLSLAPLLGLWVLWAALFWLWVPFNWRRCYAKDPRLRHEFTANISEDGVHLESVDFDANLKWPLYLRFLESDRVFLLYQTDRMFNLLPKAAFAPGEIEAFRQLARTKLPNK